MADGNYTEPSNAVPVNYSIPSNPSGEFSLAYTEPVLSPGPEIRESSSPGLENIQPEDPRQVRFL